jgi:hypothetical protein
MEAFLFFRNIYIEKQPMPKLKITQRQYNAILLHERETRLNEARAILNENGKSEAELLEEGRLETAVMVVATMLGVGLTGNNKAMAQKVVNSPKTEVVQQVTQELKNPDDLTKIFDILKSKGLKNPEAAVKKATERNKVNAEKVLKNLEDDDTKITTKMVSNLSQLNTALAQGFALQSVDVKSDTVKAHKQPHIVAFQDTLSIKFKGTNLFGTSKSTMTPEGIQAIKNALEEIKKNGGTIISIGVESSTDAEFMPSLATKSDPTGNITLANLRYNSAADVVGSLTDAPISPITTLSPNGQIPNQGGLDSKTSAQAFKKVANDDAAKKDLEKMTEEYRYVKLDIKAVFTIKDTVETDVPEEVIKTFQAKLVNTMVSHGTSGGITPSSHFKTSTFKCKKAKQGKINVSKCSFQK